MILSLFPQMTYLDVVQSRSLLVTFHNSGYIWSFAKECLIFFLVFSLLSWISMKRTASKVIYCSIIFSLLSSRLITVQYPDKNLIAIASFYSGAVACVSQLIANFFKSKRPYKVLIGLTIFVAIISPSFTSNPLIIRNQKSELFTDNMRFAAEWAVKNTNPSDIFFSEDRNFDPFVILAGRNTPIGQTNLLEYSGGNVPQMKRNLNYLYRSIANPMVLKNYKIDYVSIVANSTMFFGKQVSQSELFTHVFTHGNISLYKVVKENLNV
ncbi:hypothetical protein TVAG_192430 [Trichomonas vaginalis G3]|uniref:Uncharacterized protein n=1 Tax=Trichomonas vaginalis (strain ATCC PRA-98 / G3) TaxID=412133 RepID=A2DGV7_TRIV3|nr:hypothetical protein TVAGG3_0318870 [Trichomonas vaginalis G3]EAY20267.1 hypothetical protein TVAG_192430 [Trichomonas vaginalis G3]KAI5529139.1 hypothetical protein TVAGG3_0318870 [Trichomonas vaginalis G3]|eukprot:XP_001581253.1 hypothetical protein [Trichomonas vaginalis G3]